jgi:hypothetical protein
MRWYKMRCLVESGDCSNWAQRHARVVCLEREGEREREREMGLYRVKRERQTVLCNMPLRYGITPMKGTR